MVFLSPLRPPLVQGRCIFRSSQRTPTQSACIASALAAPSSCTACILTGARPSLWSSPSCETPVSSDHRTRTACDRTDAFPGRIGRPDGDISAATRCFSLSAFRTFPALYCVTLWLVCFLHSLPLQYVRRVFGTLTCNPSTVSDLPNADMYVARVCAIQSQARSIQCCGHIHSHSLVSPPTQFMLFRIPQLSVFSIPQHHSRSLAAASAPLRPVVPSGATRREVTLFCSREICRCMRGGLFLPS